MIIIIQKLNIQLLNPTVIFTTTMFITNALLFHMHNYTKTTDFKNDFLLFTKIYFVILNKRALFLLRKGHFSLRKKGI